MSQKERGEGAHAYAKDCTGKILKNLKSKLSRWKELGIVFSELHDLNVKIIQRKT